MQILHSKILGSGSPLLILHGFLGSGDNWISLGRQFAKRFEVHLIDLRNHGRSFHDDEMDFDVMCDDVVFYCKKKQLTNINIIGHSMGGKVAMYLAVSHPNLIKKLIVADISPKAYKRRHDFILQALNEVDFEKQKTRKAIDEVLSRYIEQENIRLFLLKNVYRASKEKLAFRFNLSIFLENYGRILETLPPLSQFEGDVLFLRGEKSDYILDTDFPLIKAHFPNAQIRNISNAGHWLHAENPVMFQSICFSFLD
jgi:pimeloyl-ACP methyl ester carboxylesterase